MTELSRSRRTSASPEKVWKIWSDTSTWGAWNPDVETASVEGPFVSGTPGRMRTKSGGAHDFILRDVEEERGFKLEMKPVPLTTFMFSCGISPAGGGATISQGISMRGALAPLFIRMAGPGIEKSFEPILEGLAREAEGGG